jgi:hypothetical protein
LVIAPSILHHDQSIPFNWSNCSMPRCHSFRNTSASAHWAKRS